MTKSDFHHKARDFADRCVFVSGMGRAYNSLSFTYDRKQRKIAIETMKIMIEELNELLAEIPMTAEYIPAFETLKSLEREWGQLY